MTRSSRHGHVESATTHWVEWLMAAVSTVLVAALLGWLVFDALRYRSSPPAFALTVLSVLPQENGYRVAFSLRNTSLSTAAGVTVRGDLAGGESADVTFDYVASESAETGALFFRDDPRAGGLSLSVTGYTDP